MDGVRVLFVSRKGNILFRTFRFVRCSLKQIEDQKTIVFIKYFKGVSMALRVLHPRHCFVLDIRSGSVSKSYYTRKLHDMRLKFETRFFEHVTAISQSLAEKLSLAVKAHIIPLGADIISSSDKTFESLHLLYVGTLFNRNIEVTIAGFKQFFEALNKHLNITYTIIGDGSNNEEHALRNLAFKFGLSDVVKITGRIAHTELSPYFDSCNIGVSYVPLTDFFDCQPVTKTFEYLLSGMPVIATKTSENNLVIKPENGVLVKDTAEDFCAGLKAIYGKRHLFDSAQIRKKAMGYTWENITKGNMKPYLDRIY